MDDSLVRKIQSIVGVKNVLLAKEEREAYSFDAKVQGRAPCAVVRPKSTDEVARVLAECNRASCPVIARGAGTGNIGGAVPEADAVVLELVRMNSIVELAPQEMIARVEAGVVNKALDDAAKAHGLMYAPDPASFETSTLGGNAATGAGGLRAVRYGVTKHHVLGLVVVMANGRIIKTGQRTCKGVVGYDLTELFIGSEGTLGIITELTVRLTPRPQSRKTLIALFEGLAEAARSVNQILRSGLRPVVMELVDKKTLAAVRETMADAPPYEDNLLLIEVAGATQIAEIEAGLVKQCCLDAGALRVDIAATEQEAESLWAARRAISPALYKIRPKKIAQDVTVPIPKLPEMIRELERIATSRGLLWAAYGHAGDGNIHANLLIDPEVTGQMESAKEAVVELFEKVLALGGTISGEHGVGSVKREYIEMELSDQSLEVQRAIKKSLDPKNILNPGKIFP
jgi:glycolate oxidase